MTSGAQRGRRHSFGPLLRAATAVAFVPALGLIATAAATAVAVAAPVAAVAAPAAAAVPAPAQAWTAPSLRSQQWYLRVLGMSQVWTRTKGAGVTVAVLDTGVQASVGDLRGAVVAGFDGTGSGKNPAVGDAEGSGTTIAVRIAGRGTNPGIIGIAPEAKIMPVYFPYIADVRVQPKLLAHALQRLRAGTSAPQVAFLGAETPGPCPAIVQEQITASVRAGMIMVAPSGDTGDHENYATYPSDCKGVVVVGSYDDTGTPSQSTDRHPYVALGGPGVAVPAYDGSGRVRLINGTDQAAAVVAGSFAILRAAFPTMPSRQLVARMLATASRKYFTGPNYGQQGNQLGFGLALVNQALIRKVPANAPNPIYDALETAPPPSSPTPSSSTVPSSPVPSTSSAGGPATQSASIPQTASDSEDPPSINVGLIAAGVGAAVLVIIAIIGVMRRRPRARTR